MNSSMSMRKITREDQLKIDNVSDRMREILVEARKAGNMDRQELAHLLGIHPSSAMRLEKGSFKMTIDYYLKLCIVYDLDPVLTLQKAILTAKP